MKRCLCTVAIAHHSKCKDFQKVNQT
jgi:hypothetical protein